MECCDKNSNKTVLSASNEFWYPSVSRWVYSSSVPLFFLPLLFIFLSEIFLVLSHLFSCCDVCVSCKSRSGIEIQKWKNLQDYDCFKRGRIKRKLNHPPEAAKQLFRSSGTVPLLSTLLIKEQKYNCKYIQMSLLCVFTHVALWILVFIVCSLPP